MNSEFKQFLDTHKRLGIPFEINWGPTKEAWQKDILAAGYNLTALACNVITVADTDYLFSSGAVGWTSDDQPIGPTGLLLFGRKKSGEIIPRIHPGRLENLAAIQTQYPAQWDRALVLKKEGETA